MVYAGHRYDLALPSGVSVLAALSTDGVHWTKHPSPILVPSSQLDASNPAARFSWMGAGAAEPDLLAGPDGRFYLFFSGLDDTASTRHIGLAYAENPLGPYTILSDPILSRSTNRYDSGAVIAPDVLLDGAIARLWYNAVGPNEESWTVGYAEHPWPLLQ